MRFLPLCALVAVLSCRNATTEMPTSTRMFYFDAVALSGGGKVYVYRPVDPMLPVEYWWRRFSGGHRDNTLYSTLYSPSGQILQTMTESIDQKGSALVGLQLAYPSGDSSVLVSATINEASMFLFGAPDSTLGAKYQIEYREPNADSTRVILSRFRHFVGQETYTFQGVDYPALRYTVNETLETEIEGFTTSTWKTTEIYALGLGLVYYKKPVSETLTLEYQLHAIDSYEDHFFEQE